MTKKVFNVKSYAIAALRRASYRTPMRYEALNKAKVARGLYKCAKCSLVRARKDIQLDHLSPVVKISGWDGFDGFITRLFCPASGLQVLCRKPCHAEKTKAENAERKRRAA